MKEPNFTDHMNLFSQFRNKVEELFEGHLSIRLITEEAGVANYPNSIMLVGETTERPEPTPDHLFAQGETDAAREKGIVKTIIGKHVDLQGFFNKDEPPYSEEFMLDLEFDYDQIPAPFTTSIFLTFFVKRAPVQKSSGE